MIRQWIPEVVSDMPNDFYQEKEMASYILLRKLADICLQGFSRIDTQSEERIPIIFKVVNLLYQGGSRYTRNAKENEFLMVISKEESLSSLLIGQLSTVLRPCMLA